MNWVPWSAHLSNLNSSHCFFEFLEFASQHQIVVIGRPAHTSHFLQPLDVVVFQPYKHFHRLAVNRATSLGADRFGLTEFMACINGVRKEAFKQSNIVSAFRTTGIRPIDAERPLRRLRERYGVVDSEYIFRRMDEEYAEYERRQQAVLEQCESGCSGGEGEKGEAEGGDDEGSLPKANNHMQIDPQLLQLSTDISTFSQQTTTVRQRVEERYSDILSSPTRNLMDVTLRSGEAHAAAGTGRSTSD